MIRVFLYVLLPKCFDFKFQNKETHEWVSKIIFAINLAIMKVKITEDGSKTVYSEQFNQTYHSIFGAKTESERVYLELGFEEACKKFENIKILEIGFGTGLNAFLSKIHAEKHKIPPKYLGIEAFPLKEKHYMRLDRELQSFHLVSWQKEHEFSKFFNFKKIKIKTEDFETD